MSRMIDTDTLRAEFTGNFNGGYYTVPEIKAIIDTAPTVGGWISVKDRLPEEEDDYLVIQQAHKPVVTLAWYSGNENGWQAIDGSFYADGIVTHYMPLPEPPKEENENANIY